MDFLKNPMVLSLIQSAIRAALVAAAGAIGYEAKTGEIDTTVGVLSALALTGVSLAWSAWTHKKNIELPAEGK